MFLQSAKTVKHRPEVLTKGECWKLGKQPSLLIIIKRHHGENKNTAVGGNGICEIKEDLSEIKGTLRDCLKNTSGLAG